MVRYEKDYDWWRDSYVASGGNAEYQERDGTITSSKKSNSKKKYTLENIERYYETTFQQQKIKSLEMQH